MSPKRAPAGKRPWPGPGPGGPATGGGATNARVASLAPDRFTAVRVDTDRRPDINERYNLGGWPTTAFLTAAGDVITGGTFVPVDRMRGVLERVSTAYGSAMVMPIVTPGPAAGGGA